VLGVTLVAVEQARAAPELEALASAIVAPDRRVRIARDRQQFDERERGGGQRGGADHKGSLAG
jgi:hypothetical protein